LEATLDLFAKVIRYKSLGEDKEENRGSIQVIKTKALESIIHGT